MKVDIQRLEHLNFLFSQVMGGVFLGTRPAETLNDLTMIQKRVLRSLHLYGPMKMSDIANRVSVSTPSATGVIAKMVRAGLVGREGDPADRRIIRIVLLEPGRKALQEISRMRKRRLKELLSHLEPAQQTELVATFERIHELLGAIGNAQSKKKASGRA